MIWLRVGEDGEWESFERAEEAVDFLNELGVGRVMCWHGRRGFETENYHGGDLIRLAGFQTADLAFVERYLEEVYL